MRSFIRVVSKVGTQRMLSCDTVMVSLTTPQGLETALCLLKSSVTLPGCYAITSQPCRNEL